MQPVLIVGSRVPGLLYVNGRPAGELGGDQDGGAVVMPVAPRGAVYIEHRPFENGYLPLTRRLTLSGGSVLADSVADAPGLSAVLWPGGVTEVELMPEALSQTLEDVQGSASDPNAMVMEDGTVRLVEDLNDTVGHARLSVFQPAGGDWQLVHTEMLWAQGAPRWPETSEDTALAALEAWFLGLTEEAMGYMTPGAAQKLQEAVSPEALGAVTMRYAAPGNKASVGLVEMVNRQVARIKPLYFKALPMGGAQGTWRIGDLSVETFA